MLAFWPSWIPRLSGIATFGRQNVPLPVWLKTGTRLILKVVVLSPPRPRLIYIRAHGCSGVISIAPPSIGHRVRLLFDNDWLTAPPRGQGYQMGDRGQLRSQVLPTWPRILSRER